MGTEISWKEALLKGTVGCCSQTNFCLFPQNDSPQLSNYLLAFGHVTWTRDPYYGPGHALRDSSGFYSQFLRKEELQPNEIHSRREVLGELQKFGEGCDNIINIKVVAVIEKANFLTNTWELYLAQDFIEADLFSEFEYRMKIGQEFSENELRILIHECTKGFLRLDLNPYGAVRMDHIYFCHNYIKVAHPTLFGYPSNLELIAEDENSPTKKSIFLSPEELRALEKNQRTLFLGWASNAFTFGVILLSLMTMQELACLYNYRVCEVDFPKIGKIIKSCQHKYSQELICMVEGLLRPTEKARLSFKQLLGLIEKAQPTKQSIDILLLQKTSQQQSFSSKTPLDSPPQTHPNYIAAFLQPRITIEGEYARLDQGEEKASRYRPDSVIANTRVKYASPLQEDSPHGNYLGQALSFCQLGEQRVFRQGKGIYQHQSGQTYIGDWHQGYMHGYGKLFYRDRRPRYEGDFKKGRFHGFGVEYAEEQIPEREEEIDEEYVKVYPGNWIRYEGQFQEDKRSGAGRIFFRKGEWRGNFLRGHPHGEGTFCSSEGVITKGRWAEGELFCNYQ